MGEQAIISFKQDATNASKTLADLQLRMAEHILTQYGFSDTTDIRHILNETKTGARGKPALLKMLEPVFSRS